MGGKKPITINETLDRLILDSSERVFYFAKKRLRHRRYAIFFVIVAVSVGFAIYSLFVKANIFYYYPTSCLGTWENPQNAAGLPSLEPNSAPELFNDENSAFYARETSEIFCGGFKTEDRHSGKIFKKATLKFSWALAPAPTPTPILEQSEFEEEILDLPADSLIIVIPNSPATSSDSLENQAFPPAEEQASVSDQFPLGPEPPILTTGEPLPASPSESLDGQVTPEPIVAPTPTSTPTATPTPPIPTPSSTPISTPTPTASPTPLSFIQRFISAAIFGDNVASDSPTLTPTPAPTPSETPTPIPTPSETPTPSPSEILSPSPSPAVVEPVLPTSESTSEPTPESTLESTLTPTLTSSPSSTAPIEQSPNPSPTPGLRDKTLDDFLEIAFSTDGKNWRPQAIVNEVRFYTMTVEIPIASWGELDRLQIAVRGLSTSDFTKHIYLDGMWIEAQYEDIQQKMELETKELIKEEIQKKPQIKIDRSEIIKQPEGKSDFKADEEPWFEIDTNFTVPASPSSDGPASSSSVSPSPSVSPPPASPAPTSEKRRFIFLAWLGGILRPKPAYAQRLADQVLVEVFDLKGHKTDIQPIVESINGKTTTRLVKSRAFKPGKYELRVLIIKNDEVYLTSQDFTWGVLAINPDKSVYLPGETANLAIAVLDEVGNMVCNASINLRITDPTGVTETLSTTNGKIKINPECQQKAVTTNPDYETYYQTTIPGSYKMKLTAITPNGTWTIDDNFEVRQTVAFDVQRLSATRIFPPNPYPVTLIVKANQNYNGPIIDYVPASFDIQKVSGGGKVSTRGEEKMIIWKTELKKGETYEFSYNYLTPNISPQFYLIGPLGIGSFSEIRKWQIAVDHPLAMILFLDAADSTPAGWTCISCASGNDFFEVFPVGSSSYGGLSAAKGNASHTPTASVNVGPATTEYSSSAGTDAAATSHAHTSPATWTSASNYPLYRVLKMIRNDAGVPSTLPLDAIAMFDTTDMPTGFSAYTSQDDYVILASGSATVATGGSDTHNHSTSDLSLAAANSQAGAASGTANSLSSYNHSHAAVSHTANTVSILPQHASVILRKVTTDGSAVPNGIIAMFDATPSADWTVLSGSGGVLENDFLEASTSYNAASGGSNTHTDSAANINAGADSSANVKGTQSGTGMARKGHTHSLSFTFNPMDARPPYKAIIIGKYTAPTFNFTIDAGSTLEFGTAQPGPSNRIYTTPCTNKCTVRLKVDVGSGGYVISAGRKRISPTTTLASSAQTSINISDTGGGIDVFDGLGANCTDGTGPAVWVSGASTGLGFTLWAADINRETACWGNGSSETDPLNTYAALPASASAPNFLSTTTNTPNPSYASVGFSLSVTTGQQATSYTGQVIFSATTNP